MKYEHKAIIDAANREGKAPSEIAHELLGHDLLKAMVTAISKPAVAFSKMSEQQQQGLIEDLTKELVPAISTAIGVICSNNTHTVRMKLKKMAVGTNYQITGQVDKTQDYIHELMDKTHDQSDVLIVLHERDYLQGLDGVQAEKDQKDLDLEGKEPADKKKKATAKPKAEKKPIELPAGQIEQAKEFVISQQNTSVAGLQNFLKINIDRGYALLEELERQGVVTAPDEKGNRQLIRQEPAVQVVDEPTENAEPASAGEPVVDTEGHDLETDVDGFVVMSDELVDRATSKIVRDQKVSRGALAVTFDLDDNVANQLMDRLELEGVISAEDELGNRHVVLQEMT